ncbi:MAG: hypothetical protein V7604_1620 [Hyphomicrobiales bacterium]|jgi:uncharacterized protein (DUF2147 family)
MKLLISLTIGAVMALSATAQAATASSEPTAIGLWEQVDEKSGQPESWFNIVEKDGIYVGTIVKMFQKPGDPPPESFRCSKCEGPDKDQPVLGLTLIKGMKRKGVKYEDGTIMDPRDGNVYRALMEVSPDNKHLEVRGYLGVALFGRSQTWNRLPDNAMDPPKTAPVAPPKGAKK